MDKGRKVGISARGTAPKDAEYYEVLDHSVGHVTRLAFRAFARALEAELAQHDVKIGQWRFLRALWIEDGLTQRELSRRVGLGEATTAIAVKGMERDKLVRRAQSEQDRRRTHIHLTPKAEKLRAVLMPRLAAVNAQATTGISERDLATMRKVLVRVRQNLHAATGEPLDVDILA